MILINFIVRFIGAKTPLKKYRTTVFFLFFKCGPLLVRRHLFWPSKVYISVIITLISQYKDTIFSAHSRDLIITITINCTVNRKGTSPCCMKQLTVSLVLTSIFTYVIMQGPNKRIKHLTLIWMRRDQISVSDISLKSAASPTELLCFN